MSDALERSAKEAMEQLRIMQEENARLQGRLFGSGVCGAVLNWKDYTTHTESQASDLCYFVEKFGYGEWSASVYFKDDDNYANSVGLGMHKTRDDAKAACQAHADKLYRALGGA